MKLGASDYVVKHGKYLARVSAVLREALGRSELQRIAERQGSMDEGEAVVAAAGPTAAFRERLQRGRGRR